MYIYIYIYIYICVYICIAQQVAVHSEVVGCFAFILGALQGVAMIWFDVNRVAFGVKKKPAHPPKHTTRTTPQMTT